MLNDKRNIHLALIYLPLLIVRLHIAFHILYIVCTRTFHILYIVHTRTSLSKSKQFNLELPIVLDTRAWAKHEDEPGLTCKYSIRVYSHATNVTTKLFY